MKGTMMKCVTILLIFLTSHAAGFVDASLPEGLEFNITVLEKNESCDGEQSANDMALVMNTEEWTTLCLHVSGTSSTSKYINFEAMIHSGDTTHALFDYEYFQHAESEKTESLAFDVYLPGSINSSDAEMIVNWQEFSLTRVLGDAGEFDVALVIPPSNVNASIRLNTDLLSVPAGANDRVDVEIISASDRAGYFSLTTEIVGLGVYGDLEYITLSPGSQIKETMILPTSTLSIGSYEVKFSLAQNSSESIVTNVVQLEVQEASADTSVHQIGWNPSVLDSPMHPGMNLTVDVNVSNYGSMIDYVDVFLDCDGINSFNDTKQISIPVSTESTYVAVFEAPHSTLVGALHCQVSISDSEAAPLPALVISHWPVDFSIQTQGLEMTDAGYHTIVDDVGLNFDLVLSNLGFGIETTTVSVFAVHEDQRLLLDVVSHVFGGGDVLSIPIQHQFETCISGIWDLEVQLDLGTGKKVQVLHIDSLFESHSTSIDAFFKSTEFSADRVVSDTTLSLEVVVESTGIGSCYHTLPLQIFANNEATNSTLIWDDRVSIAAGQSQSKTIEIDHHRLSSGTHEFYIVLLDRAPLQLDVLTLDVSNSHFIEVTLPNQVVDVQCVQPGRHTSIVPEIRMSCAISNPNNMPAVTKVLSINSEGFNDERILVVPPQDSIDVEILSKHSIFGTHSWSMNTYVLQSGEYVLQQQNISVAYEISHPLDSGTQLIDFSMSPDIPIRGSPIQLPVTIRGGSDVVQPYVRVSFDSEIVQTSSVHIDPLSIGEIRIINFEAKWPADCNRYQIKIQLFEDDKFEIPIGEELTKMAKSCPTNMAELEIMSLSPSNLSGVELEITNSGSVDSSASSFLVYFDGLSPKEYSLPVLSPGATHEVLINVNQGVGTITVTLDPQNTVREGYDSLHNTQSFNVLASYNSSATQDSELDSDGDGLTDENELAGWEVFIVRNKADLTTVEEYFDGTSNELHLPYLNVTSDILSIDSDADGLTDYAEFIHRTNPQSNDTDGDGMSDLYELESDQEDPIMVETNPAEITAMTKLIDTSNSGRAWGDKRLTTIFYIDEPNLDLVQVRYNVSGETVQTLQPEFLGYDNGQRKYQVSYTVNKFRNFISEITIHVEAQDVFGEASYAEIASYENFGSRMSTKLASYALEYSPLSQNATSFGIGLLYAMFSVLKEIAETAIGAAKFFLKIFQDSSGAWKDVKDMIDGLRQLFNLSLLKKLPGILYQQAKGLSPFEDPTATDIFVSGFVLGYIVISAALLLVGAAGFTTAKAMMKGNKGTDTVRFMDEIKKGVRSKVDSIKSLGKLPSKTKTGFGKLFSGNSKILQGLLATGAVSQYKSVSVVFKAITHWLIKSGKLDADAASRLGRVLRIADNPKVLNLQSKWLKVPFFGKGAKTMGAMRKAVNDPNLFKNLDDMSIAAQNRYMDELVDEFITDSGDLLISSGTTAGKAIFVNQRSKIDEIAAVGRTADSVTISPGHCRKICNGEDIDNLKITFNKDGSIKEIELIDRKVYGSKDSLHSKLKKSTIKRNGKTADYHKENFKKYFDGPDGKQKYKEYLKDSGLSDDEIDKLHDAMTKWADGDSSIVKSRYSAKLMDSGGGPTKMPKWANCWKPSSSLNCEDYIDELRASLKKCTVSMGCNPERDLTPEEIDDIVEELLNTEYVELPDSAPLTPLQQWSLDTSGLVLASDYDSPRDATVPESRSIDYNLIATILSIVAVLWFARRRLVHS